MLKESKIYILPKIELIIGGTLTEVLTIEELTGTKIGTSIAVLDKIVEHDVELTIHAAEVSNSGAKEEEGYSLVDEVEDTSICDT